MTKNAGLSGFILAFIAGFLSVLLFHQGLLALLHAVNLTPASPYPYKLTQPFGIPQVWSLAFWGGVWGLLWAAIAPRFPQQNRYWIAALLFGAIAPTLVAWFIVAPVKNQPLAGGFQPARMLTGILLNGFWGLGTAWLLRAFSKRWALCK